MAPDRSRHASLLRTLLVPLDGSTLAEQAIPVAADLVRRVRARLRLVAVQPAPFIPALGEDEAGLYAASLERLRDELSGYLTSKAEAVATTHGIQVQTSLLRGKPATALAKHAAEHRVDLVVMTTHGRGGVRRLWLGSVADKLLRWIAVPVLLLRPGRPNPSSQFHCILVALDGASSSDAVITPAVALARTTAGSRLVLTRIIEAPPPLVGPGWVKLQRDSAVAQLEHLAHRVRLRESMATVRVAVSGGIAEMILELSRAEQADLIVVGTRTTGSVERLMLGSVADKVVRGSDRPVLVVPLANRGAGWGAEAVPEASLGAGSRSS